MNDEITEADVMNAVTLFILGPDKLEHKKDIGNSIMRVLKYGIMCYIENKKETVKQEAELN